MASRGAPYNGYNDGDQALSALRAEGREPGTRRKKIAGYLRAANELRQSYTQGSSRDEGIDGMPGAFPDAAVVRNGEEEMLIFPSYARNHTKTKPKAAPGTIQEVSGTGRDIRDSVGAGDAEFWRQQWDKYEDDKAVVDVDVRGWLYTPHKGQLNRKHRLMVALARQLVGLPAPSGTSAPSSIANSRSSSPSRDRPGRREEELVSQEVEAIVRRGEAEADIAGRGGFSEQPSRDTESDSLYDAQSRSSSPAPRSRENSTDYFSRSNTNDSDTDRTPAGHKRSSWTAPANMSAAELAVANSNLMNRLKPFMANPLANVPISAFFYNDKVSRQRTVTTDASGHFSFRSALDFVPTHVRVLASEKLSAQEEVFVTAEKGVSLISDIDDTIRHSAITAGAREIFRNAFIRNLGDLTIEGVREWYNTLADMGVKIHYVSNSPWQLYPVLTSYFALAGLPRGSFHLKQYTGMLQGIFEPVAERKKATLDRIMRDFPERRFILVGDSGEADLEVYTDVVVEHPGRVLAIFIRDVTMPPNKGGFFDSAMGPLSGEQSPNKRSARSPPQAHNRSSESLALAKRFSRPGDIENDDEELRAAIAASLDDMEREAASDRRAVFSDQPVTTRPPSEREPQRAGVPRRRPIAQPAPRPSVTESPIGDLIDFSDDPEPPRALATTKPLHISTTTSQSLHELDSPVQGTSNPPQRPAKPQRLQSPSNADAITPPPPIVTDAKSAPPKPRKPSTSVNTMTPSPLSQVQRSSPTVTDRPPLPVRPSYRTAAKQKISAAYNALPSAPTFLGGHVGETSGQARMTYTTEADGRYAASPRSLSMASTKSADEARSGEQSASAPPPPLPRRNMSSYPVAAAQYASNRLSGTWGSANDNGNGAGAGGDYKPPQPVNKKEEMWKRRWRRSKDILDREGVILRTWREGADVQDLCIEAVKKSLAESGTSTQGNGKGAQNGT